MLSMDELYMLVEEKLSMHFDNLALVETNSSRYIGKESQRCCDESHRGMHEQYDKYAPLTSLRKRSTKIAPTLNFGGHGFDFLIPLGKHLALISRSTSTFIRVTIITLMIASN